MALIALRLLPRRGAGFGECGGRSCAWGPYGEREGIFANCHNRWRAAGGQDATFGLMCSVIFFEGASL